METTLAPTLNPLGLVKNVTGTATSLVRGAAELGLTVAGTVGEQVFRRIPGVTGDGPEPVDVVEEDDAPEPVNVVEELRRSRSPSTLSRRTTRRSPSTLSRSSTWSPPRSPRSTPRLIPARSSSRRPTLLSRSSGATWSGRLVSRHAEGRHPLTESPTQWPRARETWFTRKAVPASTRVSPAAYRARL